MSNSGSDVEVEELADQFIELREMFEEVYSPEEVDLERRLGAAADKGSCLLVSCNGLAATDRLSPFMKR